MKQQVMINLVNSGDVYIIHNQDGYWAHWDGSFRELYGKLGARFCYLDNAESFCEAYGWEVVTDFKLGIEYSSEVHIPAYPHPNKMNVFTVPHHLVVIRRTDLEKLDGNLKCVEYLE